MNAILRGESSPPEIAALLVALKMKGETAEELLGFAQAMRAHCVRVEHGVQREPVVDTCGSGGDGLGTFNISTLAALVVAGAGVKVAKHGNRSISSRCGSADLLEALGVVLEVEAEEAARSIREAGIAFLFAPRFHPAMKHAQEARRALRIRTIFNLLGPLTNPANASVQVVGAPSMTAAELMAAALAHLPVERALVVHSSDGMDEISTAGETLVLDVRPKSIRRYTLTAEDFGLLPGRTKDLLGDGVEANLAIAEAVLGGRQGPQRDVVLANAAAALVAAERAGSWREGVELAAHAIDSGAAAGKLQSLRIRARARGLCSPN